MIWSLARTARRFTECVNEANIWMHAYRLLAYCFMWELINRHNIRYIRASFPDPLYSSGDFSLPWSMALVKLSLCLFLLLLLSIDDNIAELGRLFLFCFCNYIDDACVIIYWWRLCHHILMTLVSSYIDDACVINTIQYCFVKYTLCYLSSESTDIWQVLMTWTYNKNWIRFPGCPVTCW